MPDGRSSGRRPFLTAQWRNLVLVSYAVGDELLLPYLPVGLVLDRFRGWACCSLVAFDFLDTRVRGVRWPGSVNFPEVNLRYYVRDPRTGRRGVSFVREFVPRRGVAWIARRLYNEPYVRVAMRSEVLRTEGEIEVAHRWRYKGREHSVRVRGAQPPHRSPQPAEDSPEHWFKEHEWGYGRDRAGRLVTYCVDHPVWEVHRVGSVELNVDFAALYGERWRVLNGGAPINVTLAAGSKVAVYPKED